MALTKEDLQAIRGLMQEELEPINTRLDKVDARLDKVDARLDKVDARLDKVDARLDTLEEKVDVVRQSQLNIELTELPRIAVALDGYSLARDKNEQQDERIVFLEKKTDNHDMRLFSLEQTVKKA